MAEWVRVLSLGVMYLDELVSFPLTVKKEHTVVNPNLHS